MTLSRIVDKLPSGYNRKLEQAAGNMAFFFPSSSNRNQKTMFNSFSYSTFNNQFLLLNSDSSLCFLPLERLIM